MKLVQKGVEFQDGEGSDVTVPCRSLVFGGLPRVSVRANDEERELGSAGSVTEDTDPLRAGDAERDGGRALR